MQIQDYIPTLKIYSIDNALIIIYVWPKNTGKIKSLIKHDWGRTSLNDAALYVHLKK